MTYEEKLMELQDYCDLHDCPKCVLYGQERMCPKKDVMSYVDVERAYAYLNGLDIDVVQRTFDTGAVRDNSDGKGRFDLLPWGAIWEVAKHSQRGANHYGAHNVDKGIPTSCLLDSGIRHVCRHLCGDVDEPHLVAAAWNLLWAVQMCITHPELVDTPWKDGAE